MKKEADRIKRWREKQKAEGRTSFTVLLSREARDILSEEKERTGESYAVIVERALEQMKRIGYRAPLLRPLPRVAESTAHAHSHPPVPSTAGQPGKKPVTVRTGILIDDLANEPLPEHAAGSISGIEGHGAPLREHESLITRILRSSTSPFGRKKTWFK